MGMKSLDLCVQLVSQVAMVLERWLDQGGQRGTSTNHENGNNGQLTPSNAPRITT